MSLQTKSSGVWQSPRQRGDTASQKDARSDMLNRHTTYIQPPPDEEIAETSRRKQEGGARLPLEVKKPFY